MRLHRRARSKDQLEFGIIYGGIALVVLFLCRYFPVLTMAPACAIKGLTGIPCPTCGATRSMVSLAHGELIRGFAFNPLIASITLAAVVSFLCGIISLVFNMRKIVFVLSEQEKNAVRSSVVLFLLVQWLYSMLTL